MRPIPPPLKKAGAKHLPNVFIIGHPVPNEPHLTRWDYHFVQNSGWGALAETWSDVWGDEVGALAPKNFFCRPLQNVTFGGGRRGTHCIRELQYSTHGFCVYIVDFVDFNI